ncbi:MAG: DUF308 domain-containing protein [Legionellaceae bacterium]|nr:DUF308 domain-containing protein [Legionellaceae bacterium]
MPSEIKKFNLAYTEVPGLFHIRPSVFFTQDSATNTDYKQENITHTIEKDTDRVCYLSLGDEKVSALKKKRVVVAPNGELALADNVSPDYTQGSESGRLITELVYQEQYYFSGPGQANEEQLLKANGFIYINDQGQLAGFSLLTDPSGEYPGWILATIQNTTAPPENRAVTVLATPHFVTSEAQSTVSMDNSDSIEAELKAAICNDKIANLIKGIFNTDGSVNISYLAELNTRLIPNQNFDDRDRKQAQLNILFSLADELHNEALRTFWLNQVMEDSINCFKTDMFEPHVRALLGLLELSDEEREKLKQASELYADIYMLAEEHLYQPERARKFMEIADEIKAEILSYQNIDRFLRKNAWAKKHQEDKKIIDNTKEANLAARHNPLASNFFDRNYNNLGYAALTGITVGLILGLALITSPLPPLSIALLVIGATLVCFGGISALTVYFNEKQHTQYVKQDLQQDLKQYKSDGLAIITKHQEALVLLRHDLPQAIQDSLIQEPEQEVKRPTNDSISLADSCYSLWEQVPEQQVPEQPDPNNEQTQSKPPDTPPSSSQK